jgi:hypothetical protein
VERNIVVTEASGQAFGVELVDVGTTTAEPAGGDDRLTSLTSIRERAERSVTELSRLLAHIAAELGRDIATIDDDMRPQSVEAEVHLGLSAQVGPVWLVAGKGDYSLRAKFTWTG